MRKIIAITTCSKCPHRSFEWQGINPKALRPVCTHAELDGHKVIDEKSTLPDFCPLEEIV